MGRQTLVHLFTRQPKEKPVYSDDPVELGWFGALEADAVAALLRSAGLAVSVTEVSPFTGDGGPALRFAEGSHVLVRRADLATARAVVADATASAPTDDELAAQAEAAGDTEFPDGAVV